MKSTYDNLDDIIVFDDIIPPVYQDWLFNLIDRPSFLWSRCDAVVNENPKFLNDKRNGFANVCSLYHTEGVLDLMTMEEQGDVKSKDTLLLNCFFPLLLQFIKPLNVKFLMRVRVRATPAMEENIIQLPHIDYLTPNTWNIVYYLNDTDGDTVIYNERSSDPHECESLLLKDVWTIKQRVSPKKGRAVAFKGDLFHSSSYSKDKSRFIVNINVCESFKKSEKYSQNMLKFY